ncbi:MAG: complex I subunit 4 family protein [Acidimicrobiales bacterium]
MGLPILTILVLLPVAAALLVALLPASREELAKPIGVVAAVAELGFAVALVVAFKGGNAGFQFVSSHTWIGEFGISWKVGVDGISLFLVAMTALLFPVAMAGPVVRENPRAYMGWLLLLEAACVGTFVSLDLFLFFVMFEVTLVPGYFIIAGWGGFRRNYAAMKFFIFTFAGSAFLFVGLISVVLLTAGMNGGHQSFDLITVTRLASSLPAVDQKLIFGAIAVAFAVKIPLVPFHSWLPDAYTAAPTAGSMVIAGILFKLGAYGLLRFAVFMLPAAAVDLAPVLLTLAVVGITYGSVVTVMQKDFKRLIAYASIVDVAFIVVGSFAFSSQALTGAVLEMVNHGLTTGALFFLLGIIWDRRRTYRFSELWGIQRAAPVFAGVFLLVVLSAVGLPGLNGFVGEFLVLVGTFITHRWWAVVATSGIVLTAIYLLWAYQRVFHGAPAGDNASVRDMTWREKGAIAPLLAGIVFVGVYPGPILDRITPSVDNLLAHVKHVDPGLHLPAESGTRLNYAVPPGQDVNVAPGGQLSGPGVAGAASAPVAGSVPGGNP